MPPISRSNWTWRPFTRASTSLKRGVVGGLARGEVHRHGDLVELQARLIERLEPLGNPVEPDVADAVVAQLLEHAACSAKERFLASCQSMQKGKKA